MACRRGVLQAGRLLSQSVARSGAAVEPSFARGFAAAVSSSSTARADAARTSWAAGGAVGFAAAATAAAAVYEPRTAACKAAAPAASTPATAPPPPGAPKEVVLYQYEVCPFCCKVKAFLDYHNIPYRVVEVDPVFKAELKWSDYKKVPVAVLDGDAFNDSSVIISELQKRMDAAAPAPKKGWFGSKGDATKKSAVAEESKWRSWVDETFVKVLTANIYRSWEESWQTFDYITTHGNFGTVQREFARVFGAVLMYVVGGRMPKKYNIEGDLREAMYNSVNEFVSALDGRDFMGGAKPNNADLALFGVIRAVTGTDTYWDLMRESKVLPWYQRMSDVVGAPARIEDAEE